MQGCIAVGSDADIVIWDPNMTQTISVSTHQSAADFNIFEGVTCRGGPEYVIANGRLAVDEGQLRAVQGYGVYVPTPVYAPFVYDGVKERESSRQWKAADRSGQPVAIGADWAPPVASPPATPAPSEAPSSPAHSVASFNGSVASSKRCASAHMEHFTRGPTSSGGRNMQDTTFSLSAEYPSTFSFLLSFFIFH